MTVVPEPEGCASKLMKALRVLVVEDDALIAMLLTELLAGMGHDVCATAATEAEAVIAATRYRPDLMIVDAGLASGSVRRQSFWDNGLSKIREALAHRIGDFRRPTAGAAVGGLRWSVV